MYFFPFFVPYALLEDIIFCHLKANFFLCIDCLIDDLHDIVNHFIILFDASVDNQVALEFLRLVFACQHRDFQYELITFVLGDELR